MQPNNLLFILSDEHRRDVAGCYGDPIAITPNIDALAARGARFSNAYTPCPICVPARAALATGRWVHQTKSGTTRRPIAVSRRAGTIGCGINGHRVVSIGKLHFRATDDDNGFSEEILPLHVLEGRGDLIGMLREPPAQRGSMPALAASAGPGKSTYNDYDREITAAACDGSQDEAARERQALGVVRLAGAAAFPADGAARVLRTLSAGADADAAPLRRGGTSAPPGSHGVAGGHEL